MNGNILHRLYQKRYHNLMKDEEYTQRIRHGLRVLSNKASHPNYRTDLFKDLILAIEYSNELLLDMLESRNKNRTSGA